jgi:hypothetical protein
MDKPIKHYFPVAFSIRSKKSSLRGKMIRNTASNIYVQSAQFNNKVLNNYWMYRDKPMIGYKQVLVRVRAIMLIRIGASKLLLLQHNNKLQTH